MSISNCAMSSRTAASAGDKVRRRNVPIIGRSKLPNLVLNTGHGTLGWTHSCGSGRRIARIVSGLKPEVDFAFTGA